jgi:restriction system protein
MARRRKTSFADDFMDLVARLPWWVGVLLAIGGYLLLHPIAARPLAPAAAPGQFGMAATQALWKALASAGQYLLPILCLGGAFMSAWRRRQRSRLMADVTASGAADALDGMSWREFEMLVGEAFRLKGFSVMESGGGGPDGGIDVVLSRPELNGAEKFFVQCKQWRAFKVGVDVVRELYGVMAARGAAGGYVITSGRFTEEAAKFAAGRNVQLIDGPALRALIATARAQAPSPTPSVAAAPSRPEAVSLDNSPNCPLCSKAMKRRTAKRGAHAGQDFWGCTDYPTCRGTRTMA